MVTELLQTGEMKLTALVGRIYKGIGCQKIATVWKEMEIENIEELLYACKRTVYYRC